MIRTLLLKLSDRLPARPIKGDNGEPYLERYFIARAFGCDLYLHRFLDSDPDRGYHNHPWKFAASLILSGRYLEHIWSPDAVAIERWRNPGRLAAFGSRHLHRVILPEGEPECWTLFLAGPRLDTGTNSGWGFLRLFDSAGGFAAWTFQPHHGSQERQWWKTAPTGRELRAKEHA